MIKQGIRARIIRALGFAKKELLTILRQPRLIMMLVVAPFLILLVFGLGYRDNLPPFRTLIVLDNEEAELTADLDDLSDSFGIAIDLVGTSTDPEAGRQQLRDGEIDLMVVAPDDAMQSLEAGENAEFTVVHAEVDPIVVGNIELLSRLSVDRINRRVLASFLSDAQEDSEQLNTPISEMREGAGRLVRALESNDEESAQREREALRDGLAQVEQNQSDAFLDTVARTLGVESEGGVSGLVDDLDSTDSGDNEASLEAAVRLESTLGDLESNLDTAQNLESELIVSPFGAEVEGVVRSIEQPSTFYAPAVLALLVQHLAVTFAALSLVRERELGLTDVFRVSPLSVGETLIGKYLAFIVITGVVGAVLLGSTAFLGVPLASSWLMTSAVMGLVIVASLGIGFLISGISNSDSQAIQYSMIVLLVSIFFTGFILPLDQLIPAVRWIAYLLPATYGIQALQDLMFRGTQPETLLVAGLGGYAVVMAMAAWAATRRDVRTSMD